MPNELNRYTQMLFPYIFYAPENMQAKYQNGVRRYITLQDDVIGNNGKPKRTMSGNIITQTRKIENPQWHKANNGESSFNGILFRNNRVLMYNIYTFSPQNDYRPQYLDITETFDLLLQEYNIYHLCLIIPKAVRKLYSDCTLTEKIIPYIRYDKESNLPKSRYPIMRHHNKHRKFIVPNRKGSNRIWRDILYRSIARISNRSTFAEQRNTRPDSLYFLYTEEPELHIPKQSRSQPDGIYHKKIRKARRAYHAFGTANDGTHRTDYTNI